MKWKNVFFIVVLDVFIMLMINVMHEYNNLSQRMQEAVDNITLAFDTAIDSATATEELFSVNDTSVLSSYISSVSGNANAQSRRNSADQVEASTLVWDGTSWYRGNNYILSYMYWSLGRFPTRAEYEIEKDKWNMPKVWCWLYGQAKTGTTGGYIAGWGTANHTGLGSAYTNYTVLCRNRSTRQSYMNIANSLPSMTGNSSRLPSADFADFFYNVGYKMQSTYTFKNRSANNFILVQLKTPVLLKMGLVFNRQGYDAFTDSNNAIYVNDDMISTVKFGKKRVQGGTLSSRVYDQSVYFYSPYSLGVSYVPVSVLKPMFLYHLDSIVRLGVATEAGKVDSNKKTTVDFNQIDGCLPVSVFAGSNLVQQEHINNGSKIINDGQVEYDLSSAKVRVDYYYVDAYSKSNYKLMNELYGAVSGGKLIDISDLIKKHETGGSLGNDVDGNIIVAKCTVRIKLHITYESSILQWLSYRDYKGSGENHYDIKLYNPNIDGVYKDASGVWFEYSKYYAYLR